MDYQEVERGKPPHRTSAGYCTSGKGEEKKNSGENERRKMANTGGRRESFKGHKHVW